MQSTYVSCFPMPVYVLGKRLLMMADCYEFLFNHNPQPMLPHDLKYHCVTTLQSVQS